MNQPLYFPGPGPSCDGHFQSITQCDNRRVEKEMVITQPPSFLISHLFPLCLKKLLRDK
ncbi:hypothetical protein AVEN_158454-1, partial [Araneus ventricosus]